MELIGFFYNLAFAIVALVGALLFTWWWVTVGRSSDIYAYITAYMYGVVIAQGLSLYARHLVRCPHYNPGDLIDSWWFTFRTLPEFFAVGAIVVTMMFRTVRIIRNSRRPAIHRRRRTDLPITSDNPFIEPHDPRFP